MQKSREILSKYWGHEFFRPLQEEIVDSVIYGHDTLAILPTGGGKSICFQVPGMGLDGITLVVSPLIALMQDQVDQLIKLGIKAQLLTSGLSYKEIDIALDNCRFGGVKFLYTSPERLKNTLFLERFKEMSVSLIVVDEAHCISQWGHDFRPAYREIAKLREIHPDAPVAAYTASARKIVQKDICDQLELRSPKLFSGSLERLNISYQVRASNNKLKSIIEYSKAHIQETSIIYCQTRRSVKEVVKQLRSFNLSAGFYHGGLSSEDRSYMLDSWMNGSLKIMVATNAFGMGIDKSDVRSVLHYEIPANLEAYYQEAGRAGRDGLAATAIAFWEEKDLEQLQLNLHSKYPSRDKIKLIYNAVCNFMNVAIGSGEHESYTFDISKFTKNFGFSASETFYALKILQSNDDLAFSEGNFHPTRIKIAIGNSALYKFQVGNESVTSLITLLTRSYPGIFERFIRIHENELSKRLSISVTELEKQFQFLEQYGVIDITYRSSLPTITLLHERLPESHLKIPTEIFEKKRNLEIEKLNALTMYIRTNQCRSLTISKYFDQTGTRCGNCDNCREENEGPYSFEELQEVIKSFLPANLESIVNRSNSNQESIKKALRYLILEEIIVFKDDSYHIR
ncbi:MAG: RecQ family ATP-dependent DNA helicase [Crocinitomicaceae bacterium]|nr:RecQ family ATP-dependent DNA helicase [Crocinitomicaceae bacterium]